MTVERMLESLLLQTILAKIPSKFLLEESVEADNGTILNVKKMYERFTELQDEFIQPYVIVKPSKEE